MSEVKVNKISPRSGTTVTLGDSGDTITLASGVSLTGVNATFSGDLTVDTNTLYVDSANNRVGVGTTSPTVPLHIKTTGGVNAQLNLEASSFTPVIRMYSGGASIVPSINYGTGSGNPSFRFQQITTGAGIDGATTERMRIDSSGNVGIGTSSPSAKLDVAGSLKTTGVIDCGSELNLTATGGVNFFDFLGTALYIRAGAASYETAINAFPNGAVNLYYDNSKKFETTSAGATVTGTLTATAFSGDGSGLTGISGGKVLQIQQTKLTTSASHNTNSYASFGLDVNITPTSTCSTILLFVNAYVSNDTQTANNYYELRRGSTTIISDTVIRIPQEGQSVYRFYNLVFNWIDSPATTSQIQYNVRMRTNGGTMYVNRPGNQAGFPDVADSVITAIEIGV